MKIRYPIPWRRSSICLSLLLATTACQLLPNPTPDAGATDAGEVDAGNHDAGEADAGESDGSAGDAGIACTDPSQCPDPMNECLIATCDMGICGIVAVANDTPTLGADGNNGDDRALATAACIAYRYSWRASASGSFER